MLSRVHRRAASRIAAALVAIALSGIGDAAQAAASSPGAHVCRCPRGDHHCTCPVCSRIGAGPDRVGAGPHQRHRDGAPDAERRAAAEGDDRCRLTSACHLPEVAAATDGHDPFTLLDSELAIAERGADAVSAPPAAPRMATLRPAVPPPRS